MICDFSQFQRKRRQANFITFKRNSAQFQQQNNNFNVESLINIVTQIVFKFCMLTAIEDCYYNGRNNNVHNSKYVVVNKGA